MKNLLCVAVLALAIFPTFANAQTIDPKAQTLKSQIEGFLDNQKSIAKKNNCNLSTKGNITVEKSKDGYYAFTLPHITYTDAKNIKSEIGMVAINAAPNGVDDWNMSISIPTPIISYNKAGKQIYKTNIGAQNSTGVWNEKLGHFSKSHVELSNVRFSDLLKSNSVSVQSVSINSELIKNNGNEYKGTANLVAGVISYVDTVSGLKGNLEKINLTTNLTDTQESTPRTSTPSSTKPDFYTVFSQLFGAPERIDGTLKGLDSLSAEISQSMLKAKPENRADYLSAILGVGAVGALGKPDPTDPSLRYYDIVFGENGSILLNGADIGGILTAQKK